MITKLLRRAARDEAPWTYTVWASDFSDEKYSELQLVTIWTKWALAVEVEVDEYSTYRLGITTKRRWWLALQVGPWSLVYSRERRVA